MYQYFTPEQNAELDALEKEYEKAFGEEPATYCMGDPIGELKKCLSEGKPTDIKPDPSACY